MVRCLLIGLIGLAGFPFHRVANAQVSPDFHNPLFTVVVVNPEKDQLRLFWADEKAQVFKRFDRLATWLALQKKHLSFAMNAGMYHYDFSPVGLLQIDGKVLSPLNVDEGFGNFFLKPNGVLAWSQRSAAILETSEYQNRTREFLNATQSGPLLLRNKQIHPSLDPASHSRYIRNGVGVNQQGLVFVISNQPVNFFEFAAYFRDQLNCTDALYLDGSISSLYWPTQKRFDHHADMGPILGVVSGQTP